MRRRGRAVVACPQSVRTGGPRWLRKRRGAGGGLPLRLPSGRAWPRCAGGARTRCVSSCGPCGSRWASPGSPGQLGGLRRQWHSATPRWAGVQAKAREPAQHPADAAQAAVRRTSGCCSKTEPRHAWLWGLSVNRDEVGCVLQHAIHNSETPSSKEERISCRRRVKTLNHALGAVFQRR